MKDKPKPGPDLLALPERIGRRFVAGVEELGYVGALLAESLFYLLFGRSARQAVNVGSVFRQMMQIGVNAIPIISVLSFTIGMMLAIQGIYTLKDFGAEEQVVLGIALSMSREFASLITGILVAGRSGSALAARIGTMVVNQEIDALRVMGISPARHLVAPALLAMLVMLPTLTVLSNVTGLLGGAAYTSLALDMTLDAYFNATLDYLEPWDITQGLIKSLVFALIIAMVGASNGFAVTGGAEGVGRFTTRSVVLAITYIVVADMAFTFFLTRGDA